MRRHSASNVTTLDNVRWHTHWVVLVKDTRVGGWLFPPEVLDRMAPHAASGGAIGPDGWLYLLGHDRPEMYVVARPRMGPVLVHIATIDLEAEGQAFSWAKDASRTVFTVDRRRGLVRRVRRIEVPAVAPSGRTLLLTFR